ncbi:MAG: hypothetical protein QF858_00970 [Candidatus Pacebacteria bacterium]|jgi:hypothetical protein|nr:hypothetical protein [bacterium]MDP6527437.1 hypothetical protein [Candidatus Paceibacterota bacterium]MDP6659657.1 hypothetical protein [Candidatus Paceibacterota bacterium]|tara:strand:+ start:2531 stop:3100 length:570 start_codon:yes stop_codon:yes gene_type:complete
MVFTKKKNQQALAFIVLSVSIFVVWHAVTFNKEEVGGFSFEKVPEDVVFLRHEEDERIAEEEGGVAMLHYATPEAIENGGPIYGRLGHTIVSIEYEIPIDSIGERPIGKEGEGGFDLIIEELAEDKNIVYDHMHIGIANSHTGGEHQDDGHNHEHNSSQSLQGEGGDVYLLHFMLISHEDEVRYGLTCS